MTELLKNQDTTAVNVRRNWTSASNAAADKRCEGRHIAQRGLVDTPSDDAAFGNAIHDALATGKTDKLDTQQLNIYESHVAITDKLMDKVFGTDKVKAEIFKERRWWCNVLANHGSKDPKPVRFEHSGQSDFLARIGKKALIVDYKSLPGDVAAAANNEQLRDLTVLAAGNLGLDEVYTAINQPLITHDPDVCVYNVEAIKKAEQEMFVRVRASNSPSAKRTANEVSCKFCLAKFTCSEFQAWAAPLLPETTSVAGVPVAQWTPEQRAHFCNMKGVAQKWLDDCTNEMKRLVKADPNAVPGWTLKDGQVRESVNDVQELHGRFTALNEEAKTALFLECVSVKKGELETIVRKVTSLKGKALAAKLEELLEGIVDRKQCESSLARVRQS